MLLLAVLAAAAFTGFPGCGGRKEVRPFQDAVDPGEAAERDGRPHTEYGFFPSPPDLSRRTVLDHFEALGRHADFILLQPNVPWEDFLEGTEKESKKKRDLKIQVELGRRSGLDAFFVIDPLNGLDRRQFYNLPEEWEASFGDPRVRTAFTNFTLWVLEEFSPSYIGLASEINTYMDAYPEDVRNFLSLYGEVYGRIKTESEETQVFVTFQWDDLNNMFPESAEGRKRFHTNWEQVEAFEPKLDIWAISSYPYYVFHSGTPIPENYYTPLRNRAAANETGTEDRGTGTESGESGGTEDRGAEERGVPKPIAFAEGGFSSKDVGPISCTPEDQAAYMKAVQEQLGDDLLFWVNLFLDDLDMDFYAELFEEQGRPTEEVGTLSMFSFVGLRDRNGSPKPALALWDQYRQLE
jgi:hypothetical protein